MANELEGRTALLGAGGQRRPDALAPATTGLPPRPLSDFAVDGKEANLPLGAVVCRLDARRVQEGEMGVAMIADSGTV